MIRQWKGIIGIVVVLVAAVAFVRVYVVWQKRLTTLETSEGLKPSAPDRRPSSRTELGNVVIEGPHVTGWAEDGQPQWEVWAKRVEISKDRQSVRLVEVRGNYYENRRTTSTFTAGALEIQSQQDEKVLYMRDQVIARWDAKDVTLRSPVLAWHFKQKKIFGRAGIKFTRGRWKLTGNEVEADMSMKRVKITGGARLERTA